MHPQLILIVAQQHIAELHRAADQNRLVHTATGATSNHAGPAPATPPPPPQSVLRWLRGRPA